VVLRLEVERRGCPYTARTLGPSGLVLPTAFLGAVEPEGDTMVVVVLMMRVAVVAQALLRTR
jgi:hypothetical protein